MLACWLLIAGRVSSNASYASGRGCKQVYKQYQQGSAYGGDAARGIKAGFFVMALGGMAP